MDVKDQNELQAMRKYLLKHTLQMIQFEHTTDRRKKGNIRNIARWEDQNIVQGECFMFE